MSLVSLLDDKSFSDSGFLSERSINFNFVKKILNLKLKNIKNKN